MQFIDLNKQYAKIHAQVNARIQDVLNHGHYVMGAEIQDLELKLAEYVHAKYCIALSSGTDALLVALMALDIKPGDEIITTSFSFVASATMNKLIGAKSVFVDIDPRTYNLDVTQIERAITPKTKAILPVNLYGQCADFDVISAIAKKYNLAVIEDAAQSFGGTYKGQQSCNLGTIGCTSFFPSKPLGCYGDGGACFTDDADLAERMRQIRNHGQESRYHHVRLGLNARMDTLQAAILLVKLDIFSEEVGLRQIVAKKYDLALSNIVQTPYIEEHNQSIYAQYTIEVPERDRVIAALKDAGIPTSVHYPTPIHHQPIFKDSAAVSLPNAEKAAGRVLSLPFHPYMEDADIARVAETLARAVQKKTVSAISG
ncbi:MAG: putative pyridoxal phosphate-dependent enzyme apparently involved in regulation of cell wall [Gammaproteobacteria bacterium]|jgi:UDP-2-acetamido-2-deoxy-ribo-hexuluronate aminotransferase|nr:putative pyridoxal phosphate-dependent enzyme apparently involved in regulation of cell wall [Gammaproteobacteria bacterium]